MTESESVALPLGDAALTDDIIADSGAFVKCFFAFSYIFFEFFAFIPFLRKKRFFASFYRDHFRFFSKIYRFFLCAKYDFGAIGNTIIKRRDGRAWRFFFCFAITKFGCMM